MLGRTPGQSAVGPQINSLKFVNDNKHFIAATNEGFSLAETASAAVKVQATIPGGTALVDSYKNTNIFFFVGTGSELEFPSTRLCLWNDVSKQVVGSVQFSPNMEIVDLHVLGDWVLVVFKDCLRLFHFARGFTKDSVVASYPIRNNPGPTYQGQVAGHAAADGKKLTLIFQDAQKAGKVVIAQVSEEFAIMGQGAIKESFVYASDGKEPITGVAFSTDGSLLHVSVAKGTLLNTYSVAKRELIKQFGRGKHPALVNSVSCNGVYLAACSDRGTTHLFNIASSVAQSQTMGASQLSSSNNSAAEESKKDLGQSQTQGGAIQNTFSKLYYLSSFVPYYGHEFSFARLRNMDTDQSTRQICHIVNDIIFMVTDRGNYYACPINGLETTLSAPIAFLAGGFEGTTSQ